MTSVNKLITRPSYSAGLPGGEACVVNKRSQVVKINNIGHTVKVLYDCNSCYDIGVLLLLGPYLYVIHTNGTLLEIQPHTGQSLKTYNIPNIDYMINYASIYSDPSEIPHTDILYLIDDGGRYKNAFSYNLTSGVKQIHVS